MNITQASLKNPVVLAVIIVLIAILGYLSVKSRPIQLLPNLSQPQILIYNNWLNVAPAEMESNIIEPQESILKRTPGLLEMSSQINRGNSSTSLTFTQNTDMSEALINVINNLNQASALPVDAEEPTVVLGEQGIPNVASLQIYPHTNNHDTNYNSEKYESVLKDVVEPRLARIPGISGVDMSSLRPYEVRIKFDPYKTASLGISISNISQTISNVNDVSAGIANVGRRQYTVRYLGKYDIEDLENIIISWVDDRPIYLSEIASVEKMPSDVYGLSKRNGKTSFYIALQAAKDANTIQVLDALNDAIKELNAGALNDVELVMEISYDSSIYIRRAIELVKNNLGLGVILALGMLWFFLRDLRSTLIIGISIPVSLFVSFVSLTLFDISLNVISLAGLAFSVGLILDAAIIVQENIIRYLQQGKLLGEAVLIASKQAKGALFTSTTTTIAIFLPILFLEGVEGQMFSDLAITLSVSVFASFIVAITVIPVASKKWLLNHKNNDPYSKYWDWVTRFIMRLTCTSSRRLFWSIGLLSLTIGLSFWLKPKTDFLPPAKADAVQTYISVPPGITTKTYEHEIASVIVERLKPHMEHKKEPFIQGYNVGFFGTGGFLYLYPLHPEDTDEFVDLLRGELLAGIPDTKAYPSRASLLGDGDNGGRSISINLQGSDILALLDGARKSMDILQKELPGAVIRPLSGLSLAEPVLQITPNNHYINQVGLNSNDVSNAISAFTGGMFVGEYFDGNNRYNMILRSENWENPDQLAALPITTPYAGAQPVGSLTSIKRTVGPSQLLRVDGQRTVSLQVLPIATMTVEEALDILRNKVDSQVKQLLPVEASIKYKGSADRLESALSDMFKNFLLAIVILYLIMVAIFKSLKDSFLVVSVMPLALAGGIVALKMLNLITYQSLDMLTMIGFIILLGLVVNNAILLVSQTRDGESQGFSRDKAVEQAIRLRSRPVFMSTLTSIVGMLPLLLIPGVGSDIYRGLATVIIGGMIFSMIFTLVLMPSLLRMNGADGKLNLLIKKLRNKAISQFTENMTKKEKPVEVKL